MSLIAAFSMGAQAAPVVARPRIAGDTVANVDVQSVDGANTQLHDVLGDQLSVVIFANPDVFKAERETGSLKTLVPYFSDLGYQVILIASQESPDLKDLAQSYHRRKLYVDVHHRAHLAMGLMDRDDNAAPSLNAVFLVDAQKRILFSSSNTDSTQAFSGEVLVLAARVNKAQGAHLFTPPDSSVLDLLIHQDISHQDRWFYSVESGGSLLEARQEIFLPRWQPGLQVGRRFGHTGAFFTFQYNESFDFTQEVKKLEVYHLGFGVDHVFLYGRVRTSAAAGLAILGTQTDFDDKGTKGWFLDIRPVSVRFSAFKDQAFEVSPLSMNLSIPVARGIPLILFSYFTTLSLEFGG